MAKWCPITGEKVLYLECLECDDKICKNLNKKNKQTNRKSSNFTVLFLYLFFHI